LRRPRSRPRASLDVELLGDHGVDTDERRHLAEIGQIVAKGDEAEPLLPVVRDPTVAVGQVRQVLSELVEVRLRVEEVPDEDAGDQNGPRAW